MGWEQKGKNNYLLDAVQSGARLGLNKGRAIFANFAHAVAACVDRDVRWLLVGEFDPASRPGRHGVGSGAGSPRCLKCLLVLAVCLSVRRLARSGGAK